MIIQETYDEARKYGYYSLVLMIEYLVNERKVLKMTDSEEKLTYYLQEKFAKKMNGYLAVYEKKRNGVDETSKL
jgi:hypothetical protein